MCCTYQSGARHFFPEATLVTNKFRMTKLANKVADKITNRETWELPLCGERISISRYTLLKNPENLSEAQSARLEGMSQLNLSPAEANRMR